MEDSVTLPWSTVQLLSVLEAKEDSRRAAGSSPGTTITRQDGVKAPGGRFPGKEMKLINYPLCFEAIKRGDLV